jgi:ribonuclease HII
MLIYCLKKVDEYFNINDDMLLFERQKWNEGVSFVAGVDEAGRGPLAGPVVVAAVIFTNHKKIPVVNDSKQLSAAKREILYDKIISAPGVIYAIQEISPEEIDRMNILQATHLGMRKSVTELKKTEFTYIDGLSVPDFPTPCRAIVKGDSKSASIAAASILAKTYRDAVMTKFAEQYPEYGFENHSGYGTKAHITALQKYGATPIHRKTFAPVRNVINPPPKQLELF